ncbi:MAG: TerC family protein [Pseudomonadota bacterium]
MDYLLTLAQDPTVWVALATLITMEVVLGIDNLLFIAILTNKLPEEQRAGARRLGIGLALILRLVLLGAIAFIMGLTATVFTAFGQAFSWKDIILIAGGAFLIWKATREIHHIVDPEPGPTEYDASDAAAVSTTAILAQIIALDVVFSIDSIITAVGMTPHIPIMVIAVVIAVLTMLLAAEPLSKFIEKNPTVVMLALGFLLLIGTTLLAEGFGAKIPKGYIYAAMAFAILIEGLNMRARAVRKKAREAGAGAH